MPTERETMEKRVDVVTDVANWTRKETPQKRT